MIYVAIVGAGAIARTHIEAFLKFPDRCQITAVCNWHLDKAQQLIGEMGLSAHAFSSLEDAYDTQKIDAVSICLPPAQHASAAIWALEHKLDVLVEKPMANSLEECDQMIAAAHASGHKLSVICQLRFTTAVQKVRQLLHDSRFSPVQYAVVNSLWWRGERYHDVFWRGTWESEGGGVLTSQAIHHLDLLQYLIGMPQRVTAVMDNVGHCNTQCEDVVSATLEYPDKFAQINASLVAHGEQQELCFYTQQARLRLPWNPLASKAMPNGFPTSAPEVELALQQAYQAIPALEEENHAGQIKNFLDALEYNAPLLADGLEGRKPIELITAIYKSAALHCPVTLPISRDDPLYTCAGKSQYLPHFHEKYRSISCMAQGKITFARSSDN